MKLLNKWALFNLAHKMNQSEQMQFIDKCPLEFSKIITQMGDIPKFINTYLKRRPLFYDPIILNYFHDLCHESKAILFKFTGWVSDDLEFQEITLNRYFTEYSIIYKEYLKLDKEKINIILDKFNLDLLSKFFSEQFYIQNNEDLDRVIVNCVYHLIRNRNVDFIIFSDGIQKRLKYCTYFQRGAVEIVKCISSNSDSPINTGSSLHISTELDMENNLPEKYKNYKPRTLFECRNKIIKNKNIYRSKLCFEAIPHLMHKTTKRSFEVISIQLISTVLDFSDEKIKDLHKVKIIEAMLKHDFDFILKPLFDVYKDATFIKKVLILEGFKLVIKNLSKNQVIDTAQMLYFHTQIHQSEFVIMEIKVIVGLITSLFGHDIDIMNNAYRLLMRCNYYE